MQIVLLPLLGVLIYVIARSDEMKAHQVRDTRQQEIASIAELADLKDRGILTDEEFQRVRRRAGCPKALRRHQTMSSPNSRA